MGGITKEGWDKIHADERARAIAAVDKRIVEGIASVSSGIDKLREDRAASKHYAAVLYAITNTRPDMPADERAALASAINTCQLGRGLVDKDW